MRNDISMNQNNFGVRRPGAALLFQRMSARSFTLTLRKSPRRAKAAPGRRTPKFKQKTGTGSPHSRVPVPAFCARQMRSAQAILMVFLISIFFTGALPAKASEVSIIQPPESSISAYFRHTFEINGPVRSGHISISQRNVSKYSLYLNGTLVGNGTRKREIYGNVPGAEGWDVTPLLTTGANLIAIESIWGAIAIDLEIILANGETMHIATDENWRALPNHALSEFAHTNEYSSLSAAVFELDARLMPRVVLGPVAGYADPRGIYMQFVEWFMPAYDDREWPRALVTGVEDLLPVKDFPEPARPTLFDFTTDVTDYGDVTPDNKLIGRKSVENCTPPAQNTAAAHILPPQYAESPFKVNTPDQSAAFIVFNDVKMEQHQRFFMKLFSSTGGELIEAYHVSEFLCVADLDLNNMLFHFSSEQYIARKGIQDWHLLSGNGSLLLVIRNAHEPLFIHSVGIQ